MVNRCYIGLGSNLGDPAAQLRSALRHLAACPEITVVAVSRFYASKPMGPQDQPDYVNAVACVETALPALDLLQILFAVERAHGRVRDAASRWGARTLDLDLLLYGDTVMATPDLILPHPGLCQRSFVVLPLLDIAPTLCLPDGRSVLDCMAMLACDDVVVLGDDKDG